MIVIRQIPALTADVRQLLDSLEESTLGMTTRRAGRTWFLACDTDDGGRPIGFAACYRRANGTAVYTAAGVLRSHRGQGIHRRLIRARERWARRNDCTRCEAYTAGWNHQSANNLIRCGYRLFTPTRRWGCTGALYFVRDLTPSDGRRPRA